MPETDALIRQRRALADFGVFALRSFDIAAVLNEACRYAAEALGIEMAKVLELRPQENSFLIVGGYGLLPGTVGEARVLLGRESGAGLALLTGEPVTCLDTLTETRFELSETVRRHGVRSMANVLISLSDGSPYGILELDSREPGMFRELDTPYLQSYANLVGAALERWRSRNALQVALEERDILMRELQHRVKNDLQAIVGLLVVEGSHSDSIETRHRLERVRSRVNALRLVHDRLFRDQRIGRVNARSYLEDLARGCIEIWSAAQSLEVELLFESVSADISHDTAVSLGLIVNEFITNSVKHAFPFGRGRISLVLEEGNGEFRLRLADDGVGLPDQVARHSGRRFIEALARQINANWEWSGRDGVQLIVRFSTSV